MERRRGDWRVARAGPSARIAAVRPCHRAAEAGKEPNDFGVSSSQW